jgi:hypothetical protein
MMPLILMKRYTRQIIRQNPDWLFVFGDNFANYGYGGQAREARGEPNAVGIATKRSPGFEKGDYLSDDDLLDWERDTDGAWTKLFDCLDEGGTVVWPEDGIGTGLAKLDEKAPRIAAAIALRVTKMKEKQGDR